jgi:hypothetical protein
LLNCIPLNCNVLLVAPARLTPPIRHWYVNEVMHVAETLSAPLSPQAKVWLSGCLTIVGGGPRLMTTVWQHVFVLPAVSVASHVRQTTMVFVAVTFVVVFRTLTVTELQASEACGWPKPHEPPGATFCVAGTIVKVGGVVSLTVIVWITFVLNPAWPIAVQVRKIMGNDCAPE